jgi:hypothetical protein
MTHKLEFGLDIRSGTRRGGCVYCSYLFGVAFMKDQIFFGGPPAYDAVEFALKVVVEKLDDLLEGKDEHFEERWSMGNIGYLVESYSKNPPAGLAAAPFFNVEEKWRLRVEPALRAGFRKAIETELLFTSGFEVKPSEEKLLARGEKLAMEFSPEDTLQQHWFLYRWKMHWHHR